MLSKTAVPPGVVVAETMTFEAVAAMALVIGKSLGKELSIEDLSELFVGLRAVDLQGFAINIRIALKRVPSGFFSDDIAGWVGRLAYIGYVKCGSCYDPIKLNDKGWQLCREVLVEEFGHDPLRFVFLANYFVKVLRNK